MNSRGIIARLTAREYLPLSGWLLTWAIITTAIGLGDATLLLAATIFVRAAQSVAAMDTGRALRRRFAAGAKVFQRSRRLAIRIELLSLAGAALILCVLTLVLAATQRMDVVHAVALIGLGMPARVLSVLRRPPPPSILSRQVLAWGGVLLVAIAAVGDLSVAAFAAAMGLREWLAFAAGLMRVTARTATVSDAAAESAHDSSLTFREVANLTAVRARHRLSYRLVKSVLGIILGPFGSLFARTSRGVGLHKRLICFTPRTRAAGTLLALTAFSVAIAVLTFVREPAAVLACAALLRLSASAATAVLWWNYAEAGDEKAIHEYED